MKIQITGGVVDIDESDAPIVMAHSWYVNEGGYAISRVNGRLTRMHRLLTGADSETHVDHENRNGLDNRRNNLRLGSRNQNMWNSVKKDRGGQRKTSSKYKGVHFDSRYKKWVASVWKFSKKIFVKSFLTEDDAAIAYNIVAKREFGNFALFNHVDYTEENRARVAAEVDSYTPNGPPKGGCVSRVKWGRKTFRWLFRKIVNGKLRYMGAFKTREEAEAARSAAFQQLTGGDGPL